MKISREMKKSCKEIALSLMQEQYALYDAIWTDRIRITPALFEHGEDIVKSINQIMPNLLVHKSSISAIDEVTERYNFESTSALIEYLLAYQPRKSVFDKYYEQLLGEITYYDDDLPF